MSKIWINKNGINKRVSDYDYTYHYMPMGYTRGMSKTKVHYKLNDKVLVKVKRGQWTTGVLHDIFEWCYIILCDKYMNGNSNLVVINREDVKTHLKLR